MNVPRRTAALLSWLVPLAACVGPCPCPPVGAPAPAGATVARAPDALGAADGTADGAADGDAAALGRALDDLERPGGAERAVSLGLALWRDRRLVPALEGLAARTVASRPALAARVDDLDRVAAFVAAELWLQGLDPRRPRPPQPSWDALAREHARWLAASRVPREARSLEHPAYVAELEAAGGAPFTEGNAVEVLVDGPASWAVRGPLLAGATREVLVASWAIYDDGTGQAAVDDLLAALRRGVAVDVVVDGQTATLPAYRGAVERLRGAASSADVALRVTPWRDATRPFDGMHQKVLLVDGRDLVLGGMNWGDAYSHRDGPGGKRWRDTDVHVRGPAVAAARAAFLARWRGAPAGPGPVSAPGPASPPVGSERVAVLEHAPGDDDPILRSLLKAFDGARTSIDVEHAYVVRIPSVEATLLSAVRRGVRVRVLTNSATSCDEPIIAGAILRSVGTLADGGVEVFLRRGSTLHGKFVTVDGVFAQIGSYNLHPRSHRLEHEIVVNVLGRRTAAALDAQFARDLAAADRVRGSGDVVVPPDPIGRLAWILFPDLL